MFIYFFCSCNYYNLVQSQSSLADDVELVGSWTVDVGDQDQALHLWKYKGGFETIVQSQQILEQNKVIHCTCCININ